MTIPMKQIAAVAALSLTLPGCSALFGSGNFARHGGQESPKEAPQLASQERPSVLTNMGRRALDQGRTGLAIEAFRRALAGGEEPAAAHNGLGVAYARIGRVDLAQRYFEQAATIDPANARYQANLARLIASPLFARRHDGDRAEALLAQAEKTREVEEAARQAAAPGRLQRVGANQFFIQTAAPAATGQPVRTAMVVTRAKARPAAPEPAADAATPAEPAAEAKPTPRTIEFKPAAATASGAAGKP